MMSVHSEMVEQPLVELLQETSQAHFLHALTVQEALVVLRERCERLRCLLQLFSGQEQHAGSTLMMDHFRLLLAAELAWIERAIAVLQGSGCNPAEGVESAESRGS